MAEEAVEGSFQGDALEARLQERLQKSECAQLLVWQALLTDF